MSSQKNNLHFIKDFAAALLLVLFLRTFFFQHSIIPSGSMFPTTLISDFLFVSKYDYGFSTHTLPWSIKGLKGKVWKKAPKRGDVVVFRVPQDNYSDWIKRVVGVPGDTIMVEEGRLIINGEELHLERIDDMIIQERTGELRNYPQYIQTLPSGKKHHIVKRNNFDGSSHYDDFGPITLKKGYYFMMGDNRDGSDDSRGQRLGLVHEDQITGRARFIFYSTDALSLKDITRWITPSRFYRIFTYID